MKNNLIIVLVIVAMLFKSNQAMDDLQKNQLALKFQGWPATP